MPAQAPTGGPSRPTNREAQRRQATQDGADAAQANQRALGSAASVREARSGSNRSSVPATPRQR